LDASTYQTVKRLYLEALCHQEPGARARFLSEACAGDGELRREVESLLSEGEGLGAFLEQPVDRAPLAEGRERGEPSSHPERIGAYRIVRPLGWGGMGVVYLAEQDSPSRLVALKLLRHDASSPAQIVRFEREAELLGRLGHPGIARVYEAAWAETETGRRPFFAMELVAGKPLLEFADDGALALPARVALVSQVAEAVHYAHEHGVVHRDLKPSNVLVDERGQPKVVDFGVARALGTDSQATQTGQLVGTLAYMSPEQASGRGQIDARSDVYSLGVLAYQLLTGRLPIVTDTQPLHEAVRRIREEEPISAGSIRRELAGDLETILGKALAKEPARRYASAAALAEDLRLFLDHRPIRARRPTSWYVGWKFVRRHRALTASVLALFLALNAALLLYERGRRVELLDHQRAFFQEAEAAWRERAKLEDLARWGEYWLSLETPPIDELALWLADVEDESSELARHRALLEQARGRLEGEDPVASLEERRSAFELRGDIIERIEGLLGPRGLVPRVQAKLEELRARARARLAENGRVGGGER